MSRLALLVFTCICLKSAAQQTAVYLDPERQYQVGLDLLYKEKYGAAQKAFMEVLSSNDNVSQTTRSNATFFVARCASELFNKDAEYLLLKFIEENPGSIHYDDAVYELGNYYYRLKRYKPAVEWLAKIDQTDAGQEMKDEVNFKIGYASYMTNDYEKAEKAFYAMKDGNSKYATAAQYYYAHIAYVNGNYETALNSFMKLKESEAFAPVAPYYITQIYYRQGRYDDVLKYAPNAMDTVAAKNGLEISRMIGESYYRKDDYKDALPYLLDYEKNSAAAGRADFYTIAFTYYRLEDYEKAAAYFQKVISGEEDSLAQNAYYHLADCFLHSNNKRSARNAFQSASKMEFDPVIGEISHFNYAKLSYELSFQSVAIESFRSFMQKFPESQYYRQAEEMIIDIYATTRNYKDAIAALESVGDLTPGMKSAYQKVAYYRGIELYMDGLPAEAVKMFELSLTNPMSQTLVAEANYWMGEAQYKMEDYEASIKSYSSFLVTPAALRLKKYNTANYNIGYAFFKKEEYDNSQMAFRKYILEKQSGNPARMNDALLRLGDCYFMMRDLASAMEYYNQAISSNAKASDYALFQKGIIYGVQGRMQEKVTTMQKLMDKYPKSIYYDDALYEAGQASFASGNNDKAVTYFRKIKSDYGSGPYARKAELGEAMVLYNTNQDERAMTAFKNIVQKYPNTEESHEALVQMKNISVSQNKVDEYLAYIKSVPNTDLSASAEDSLTYEAAELLYTQRDCQGAISDFTKYLEKFPNGIFRSNATYLRSDCLFRDKKYTEALPGYEFILDQPAGQFTEKAILNAALIYNMQKQYDKALAHFEMLQTLTKSKDMIIASLSGQLRAAYNLGDCNKSVSVADEIYKNDAADKDLINEAHLIAGRCQFNSEDWKKAKENLSVVAKRTNSEMTAESKYLLAAIEYNLKNYKESQKLVFEIQKQTPSYDFWIAKGFILLGDNYLALKDTFQAKETYKSIVENFEYQPGYPEDLRDVAREKLAAVVTAEEGLKKPETKPVENDTLEIETGN